VTRIATDITTFRPLRRYAVRHDRAVLHVLVGKLEQGSYMEILRNALAPGGHVIQATFGPGGPTRCSGLPVECHSVETLSALLGPEFELRCSTLEDDYTPARVAQRFLHTSWQARA
jgi:hypothetical protein